MIMDHCVKLLVLGRCGNVKNIISKHIFQIKFMSSFCKIALV